MGKTWKSVQMDRKKIESLIFFLVGFISWCCVGKPPPPSLPWPKQSPRYIHVSLSATMGNEMIWSFQRYACWGGSKTGVKTKLLTLKNIFRIHILKKMEYWSAFCTFKSFPLVLHSCCYFIFSSNSSISAFFLPKCSCRNCSAQAVAT